MSQTPTAADRFALARFWRELGIELGVFPLPIGTLQAPIWALALLNHPDIEAYGDHDKRRAVIKFMAANHADAVMAVHGAFGNDALIKFAYETYEAETEGK